MTLLNLFRGQCIGVKVSELGDDLLLTLDLEDYNRLPPIINVGAPDGASGLVQDDGTVIWVEPRAGSTGAATAFRVVTDGGYWPVSSPTLDLIAGFLAPEVPGSPLIDQMTAMTNLKAFIDMQAPRVSGSLRWWIAPPPSGDGLVLYWVDFADPVEVAMLPAPFAIDTDAPDWTTSIMPISLGPISWDWSKIRGSVYVRGGTPAPEGSGWATGVGSSFWGDAYVDAPGSITTSDRDAIGIWHQSREFIELMTGSAVMPSFLGAANFHGWAVGQTVLITSARHSRFTDHELSARPAVIQRVSGALAGPLAALAITIDGTLLTLPFEWKSFAWESVLGSTGKATAVIHLLGDTDTLAIGLLADVWITLDDSTTADLEWSLQFGDIPTGSLARELSQVEEMAKYAPRPVYRFRVEVHDPDGVMAGVPSDVSAQLSDGSDAAIALPLVDMEWTLIQWEDAAETIAGTALALDNATGTTDSAGRVFNTLTAVSALTDEYNFEVGAVALEVV